MHDRGRRPRPCPWLTLDEVVSPRRRLYEAVGRPGRGWSSCMAGRSTRPARRGVRPPPCSTLVLQKLRARVGGWLREAGVRRVRLHRRPRGSSCSTTTRRPCRVHGRRADPQTATRLLAGGPPNRAGEVRVAPRGPAVRGGLARASFSRSPTAVFDTAPPGGWASRHGGNSLQERVNPGAHRGCTAPRPVGTASGTASRRGPAKGRRRHALRRGPRWRVLAQQSLELRGARRRSSWRLRVPDADGVLVELCQGAWPGRGSRAGVVAATVGEPFEIFFPALRGPRNAAGRSSRFYHPSAVADVAPGTPGRPVRRHRDADTSPDVSRGQPRRRLPSGPAPAASGPGSRPAMAGAVPRTRASGRYLSTWLRTARSRRPRPPRCWEAPRGLRPLCPPVRDPCPEGPPLPCTSNVVGRG